MSKSLARSPRLECIKNNKNNFPRVSIIVPARNEETYIRKCVDSLLKQVYPDYEIILVNVLNMGNQARQLIGKDAYCDRW